MNRTLYLKLGILLLLSAALFYDTFTYMVSRWNLGDNNYCYLIPLVVAYLVYEKWEDFRKVTASSSWKGLYLLVPGIMLYWFGELAGEYFTLYLASWLIFVGIVWMMFGWKKMRVIGFALLMILTMFPLPSFFSSRLSLQLKLISSKLGVDLMHLLGMAAYRSGNIIDLGFTQLQVVDACSGLRYFFPLIIMGLLVAYTSKTAMWKKVIVVLSTIPLVVMANSVRIAGTALLYEHIGPEVAEGFFHDFAGFFMFIASILVLVPEIWLLNRLFPEKAVHKSLNGKGITDACPVTDQTDSARTGPLMPPQFIAAGIILAATFIVSHGIEFREIIPIKKPFSTFPMQIGKWHGTIETMKQKFIDALDFSDYLLANYEDTKGDVVNFYVAYYESQSKGESIHSPTTCFTGGGWVAKDRRDITIKIPGRPPFKVKRALLVQPGTRELAYYWFPMRGRILTSAYQMKLYNFIDALTLHRTDGALVRLITPIGIEESPQAGDARLQTFMKDVLPVLDQYLPK